MNNSEGRPINFSVGSTTKSIFDYQFNIPRVIPSSQIQTPMFYNERSNVQSNVNANMVDYENKLRDINYNITK
jgi:hypothetical protein